MAVLEAILSGRQPREKLKGLHENPMSNNFRKTAVLKKIYINRKLKLHSRRSKELQRILAVLKFLQSLALDFPYICLQKLLQTQEMYRKF